jgi:hypothetical protein
MKDYFFPSLTGGSILPSNRRRQSTSADAKLGRKRLRQNESHAGYFYVRISRKEPFDILYSIPAETAIVNLDYGSFSLQFGQPFLRVHKYLAGI